MKTLKNFRIYWVISTLIFIANLFSQTASADLWSRETKMGQTVKNSVVSGSEPSAADRKNGGANSIYAPCSGFLMVEASDFKKNETYWTNRKNNCDSKIANCALTVQVIPDTGILASRSVVSGVNVSSAVSVGAFLESVRIRASEDLTANIAKLESKRAACFGERGRPPEWCSGAISDIKSRIGKELPEFRNALALMSVPSDVDIQRAIVSKDVTTLINHELKPNLAFTTGPKLASLNTAELAAAKKYYEVLIAKAQTEFEAENEALLAPLKVRGRENDLAIQRAQLRRPENFTNKVKSMLNNSRGENVARYNDMISRVPEIAYIGDSRAENSVIAAGLATMIGDAKESLARIKKTPTNAKDLSAAKVDSSLLQYAAYSRLIEKMLTEEQNKSGQSSCAVATAAFNQLKTVEGRNAAYATLAIVGSSVGFAVAPWAASAMGIGMSTGAAALSVQMAVASGLIGGFAMTAHDVSNATDIIQDARSGLVTSKDAEEAKTNAALGLVTSPLNFLGSGALVGAGVAGSSKVLSRYAALAVAKGEVKVAGTSADDVLKLARVEKGEVSIAAIKKIDEIGEKAAREVLGRPPTASDEVAAAALAKSGFLGSSEKPIGTGLDTYADVSRGMSEAERLALAQNIKKVGETIPSTSPGNADIGITASRDAGRETEVARLAVNIAAGSPDVVGTAAVLSPKSGWSSEALRGVRYVLEQARNSAGRAKSKIKETLSARNRRALAESSGKPANSKDVDHLCFCSKLCAAPGFAGARDPGDRQPASISEPVQVAACTLNP